MISVVGDKKRSGKECLLSTLAACLQQVSVLKTSVLGYIAVLLCSVAMHTAVADTLIYGGTILTMADEQTAPFIGYVHIKEDKISAIGPMSDVPSDAGHRIDASGKVVFFTSANYN